MSVTKIVNEIDENIFKAHKIIDNFHGFEEELGKEKTLRAISQFLTTANFRMLALLKELNLPMTEFEKRRHEGSWDNSE